jgi:hypothetical protein
MDAHRKFFGGGGGRKRIAVVVGGMGKHFRKHFLRNKFLSIYRDKIPNKNTN